MTDIGTAAVRDARACAPVLDDGDFVDRKSWIVFKNIRDPAKTDSTDIPDILAGRYMKHRSVDPVQLLADIFDEQVDPAEIGLERGPKKVRQNGQVERERRRFDIRL